MILDIEKINKIIIGGDITKIEKDTLSSMFDDGKTMKEVKDYLISKGHQLIDEGDTVNVIGLTLPLQEEKDIVDFFKAFNEIVNKKNKEKNPLCSNQSHEHFIKQEET